jgi:hypothetical protein
MEVYPKDSLEERILGPIGDFVGGFHPRTPRSMKMGETFQAMETLI